MGEHADKAKGKNKQASGALAGDEKPYRDERWDEIRVKVARARKELKDVAKIATENAKKATR